RGAAQGENLTLVSAGNNVNPAMPIYEYRCTECDTRFSQQEGIEEHGRKRPACPKCKSRAVEQVFSPFFAKTVRKSWPPVFERLRDALRAALDAATPAEG